MTSSPVDRYSSVAIAFHWLLAVMIVGSFCVGLYMSDLAMSPTRLKLFNWHKWAGMTILTLSALRLLWRLTHRPPPDVPMAAWQRRAAHAVHFALYALFFLVPLAGWAYSSAAGFPVVVFGLIPLPDFVPVDKPLAEILKTGHHLLAFALGFIVLIHIGAAVKHHAMDGDGLLLRMWPRTKSNTSPIS
ncbi:MAG: cytochrome b [Burkholderiales bacterium]